MTDPQLALVPRATLVELESEIGCCFWACPGPDVDLVPMATCVSCVARQTLRKLIAHAPAPAHERLSMAAFVALHDVDVTTLIPVPPNKAFFGVGPLGRSWTITLRCGDRRMVTPFHQGPALREAPTTVDVLGALAMDATSYVYADGFRDWAADLGGGDGASPAIYQQVEKQTNALRTLLGQEAFDLLLWGTDPE